MSKMDEKEENLLEAAQRVFHRYGVKRASMADIASEAGVSRQTLYNAFDNKDDIFRGTIRLYTDLAVAEIEETIAGTSDVSKQIGAVLDVMSLKPYRNLKSSPNAEDLVAGFNAVGKKELENGFQRYRGALVKIFAPHADVLKTHSLTPESLAEIVQRGASAMKYNAASEEHLVQMLDGVTALAVHALTTPLPSK